MPRQRKRWTPQQREQSRKFAEKKAAREARQREAAARRQQRADEQRRIANHATIVAYARDAQKMGAFRDREQAQRQAEILPKPTGPKQVPGQHDAEKREAIDRRLAGRNRQPGKVGAKSELTGSELDEIIEESKDASEQRLRSYDNFKRALHSKPTGEQIRDARDTMNAEEALLKPLQEQRSKLSQGKSRRKTTKLRQTRRPFEKQQARAEEAETTFEAMKRQKSEIQKHLEPDFQNAAVARAAQEWVEDPLLHNVNVRTLGSWTDHQKPWVERNKRAGRTPEKGEYLNVDKGWTDYINQGYMQRGYDRGAAFRLLTPVDKTVEKIHNEEAGRGDRAQRYDKRLTKYAQKHDIQDIWHGKNQRKTFYGQELVDAAGAGYAIHRDEGGRQSVMPKAKSALLNEIRDRKRVGQS